MTLLGIGGVPGVASAQPRHDGHARRGVGEHRDSGGRSADRARHALRRSRHRQPQDLRAARARRSTSTSIRAELNKNVRVDVGDRRRCAARSLDEWLPRVEPRRSLAVARAHQRAQGRLRGPRHPESARRRPSVCRARDQRHLADDRRQRGRRHRRRPASDVGSAVLQARIAALAHHLGRPRHDGLRAAGGDRRQDRPCPTPKSGWWSATAASR